MTPQFSPADHAGSEIALRLLAEAHRAAVELGLDPWEFAVEIEAFRCAGVSNTDLRRLLVSGAAAHGLELSRSGPGRREFRRVEGLALPEGVCFVLARAGQIEALAGTEPGRPTWNASGRRREWRGRVIKTFRRPAANQTTILDAFEEEGWPERIDDPLPMTHEVDPKLRLRDAVRCLNRCHRGPALRFLSDGTGLGILWRVDGPEPAPRPPRGV